MSLFVLDCLSDGVRCYRAEAPGGSVSEVLPGPSPVDAFFDRRKVLASADAIAIVLRQGGDRVEEEAMPLKEDFLPVLDELVPLDPEANSLARNVARKSLSIHANVPHVLLCETALFNKMPAESASYAMPPEFRGTGQRRHGLQGLAHRWLAGCVEEATGAMPGRMVSAVLGPLSTVAAWERGTVVETSAGFSPLEGIPSQTGCGDIDPSLVLNLRSSGMKPAEINRMLAQDSGLQALAGKQFAWQWMFEAPDSESGVVFAREVWMYHVLKYLGAFTAVLGGVDTIAFAVRSQSAGLHEALLQLAGQLSKVLAIELDPGARCGAAELTTHGSAVRILVHYAERAERLARLAHHVLQGGMSHV